MRIGGAVAILAFMTRLSWVLLLAGGSTLLTAGCAAAPEFRDRALATIPEGARVDIPVAFSRDGRRCAYVERAPNGAVRGSWTRAGFDSL